MLKELKEVGVVVVVLKMFEKVKVLKEFEHPQQVFEFLFLLLQDGDDAFILF